MASAAFFFIHSQLNYHTFLALSHIHTPNLASADCVCVWLFADNKELLERFHFLHNKLKIPHGLIAKQPHALLTRVNRIRVRHFFLESLGKAQYDPRLPNYVSLVALVTGNDAEFASNVGDTSPDAFRSFLKTI